MINHLLSGLSGELTLLEAYEPFTLGSFLIILDENNSINQDSHAIIAAVWTRIAQSAAEKALDFNTPESDRIFNLGKLEAIRELCGELRSYLNAFQNKEGR